MSPDVSLLINLSAGDAAYGYLTARALAEAHQGTCNETVLVLDLSVAQPSKFYDHAGRYREPAYSERARLMRGVADRLQSEGWADRVVCLDGDKSWPKALAKRYFGSRVRETHDFRGAPITAYTAGLESCRNRFVVRYDGDILLHQPPGGDWVREGLDQLSSDSRIIAVSPCPAPPHDRRPGFFDDLAWFSTRCLLLDRQEISRQLPLVTGRYRLELFLRKILDRTYPPAFETMLTRKLQSRGFMTRYLVGSEAWYLHPEDKGELFLELLPELLFAVRQGRYPSRQTGCETLDLPAWEEYLHQP